MASKPRTASRNEPLKRRTLFIGLRKIVQPDNDVVIGQIVIIEICPVGRCIESEFLLLGNESKEIECVACKIDMVHLSASRIKPATLKRGFWQNAASPAQHDQQHNRQPASGYFHGVMGERV